MWIWIDLAGIWISGGKINGLKSVLSSFARGLSPWSEAPLCWKLLYENSWKEKRDKMRECLSIHVGQAGAQVSIISCKCFWRYIHWINCRSVMLAGNFTVWNMEFSPTAPCLPTKRLETIPSPPFSPKPELANTYPGPSLSIWNPPLLVITLLD